MNWFETLVGFPETTHTDVQSTICVEDTVMISSANGKRFSCGTLEIPSLADLRERAAEVNTLPGKISVREVVANVQDLHRDVANSGALFQVASQFNLLEMVSPSVTKEKRHLEISCAVH